MVPARGSAPLSFRRLATSELDVVTTLDFAVEQIERFLGPLHDIVEEIRRGPAHAMIGIEEDGRLIGFAAVHPDRRDAACWWLGWFGIDRTHQGGGRGGRAIAAILERLRRLPGCREIRLLVAPDNVGALRLYHRAGFLIHGLATGTGEWIMRCRLGLRRPSGTVPARFWANAILLGVIDARKCRMGIPVAAQLHGEVAFPP